MTQLHGSPGAFDALPRTAANHFKLCFYGAVLHMLGRTAESVGSVEAAVQHFPFLAQYRQELAAFGIDEGSPLDAWSSWSDSVRQWEASASCHLPLAALRSATGVDDATLTLLLTVGMVEEDARFGLLFEELQGTTGLHRPTAGLLQSWFEGTRLQKLQDLGALEVSGADRPRSLRAIRLAPLLWDAIREEPVERPAGWIRYHRPEQLGDGRDLVISGELRAQVEALPRLFESGELRTIIVRGPQHNGRRNLLGAISRNLGRGLLQINGLGKAEDERWRPVGLLATLLHATPAVVLELAPGETMELPEVLCDGPFAIVLNQNGGVSGPPVERSMTLSIGMPDLEERRRLWLSGCGPMEETELDVIAERFRMTSGNIRRTAGLAASYAAMEQRSAIAVRDVQQARRMLNRQGLERFAKRVESSGDWSHLALPPQPLHELMHLESRCRHRETLKDWVGPAVRANLNAGVRALLSGPSGTGKTLAAHLLASVLQMDLYRLDLSTVVNKYIGETEKHLDQVFARAEELDVILLLDEGDALLTQRTNVNTSNDRYANLETNYLIQRLESFEGILIVTTNAAQRIDNAFQRRMDIVVNFRMPEPAERWSIWQMHLPAAHSVDEALLREVANRCALTGGQIRNAALHASLLSMDNGRTITSLQLEAAVQREYTKTGAVCPLPRASEAYVDY